MTPVLAVELYSQVLVELVGAFGLALFAANVFALVRRRSPVEAGAEGAEAEPGPTLTRAPVVRTLVFAAIGAVLFIWAVASYLNF